MPAITEELLNRLEELVCLQQKETLLKKSHRAYLPIREKIDNLCADAEKAIPRLKREIKQLGKKDYKDIRDVHEEPESILSINGSYFLISQEFFLGFCRQLRDFSEYIGNTEVTLLGDEEDERETEV